jgi:putative tricarboxylic transport membrane protein
MATEPVRLLCWVLVLGAAPCVHAAAAWKPTQNVEIIVPAAAGGASDRTGRLVQRTLRGTKLVDRPIAVVNKPVGGHTIGLNYLNQRPGDGNSLMVVNISLLTDRITGKTTVTHKEVTPLAVLYGDYTTLSVSVSSSVKTCADLIERLKQDPSALSIALAGSLGNANHLGVTLLAKTAGIDIKKLKIVVHKFSAEAMTALLGGHVDVVAAPALLASRYIQGGKLRVLGVSSPQRLGNPLAEVPTFRELGYDAVFSNWRSLIGPKGLGAAQLTYWDGALMRMVQADEWKKEVEKNLSQPIDLFSADSAKFFDEQYNQLSSLLTEIGLAK